MKFRNVNINTGPRYVVIMRLAKQDNKSWIVVEPGFKNLLDRVHDEYDFMAEFRFIVYDNHNCDMEWSFPNQELAQEALVLTASGNLDICATGKLLLDEHPSVTETLLTRWDDGPWE